MTNAHKKMAAARAAVSKVVTKPPAVLPAVPTTDASTKKVEEPERKAEPVQKFRLKIFGVGGAGCNLINQIAAAHADPHHGLAGVELVAINTDVQGLASISATEKIQIGAALTRGLGAGGDVEIGARAAQVDNERLQAAVQHVDVVFIAAAMGGGTGGGAAPALARIAKEQGALVLAFAVMPFSFEGGPRRQQALLGLEQLRAHADAVICVHNDKLAKLVGENASVVETFRRGDEIIAQGAQAIWQLLSRKGLINLNFADLRATLGDRHGEGIFGFGEGQGQTKARDAAKALLEHPILGGPEILARAESILVSVLGGPDLTLPDVQRVVEPITRHAPRARVTMGAAIDENFNGRLAVTVIAATNIVIKKASQPIQARPQSQAPPIRSTTPPPTKEQTRTKEIKPRQVNLPLEGVSRGRFDDSEPTLYNGEDLDVPTFIRRGVSLKR